MKQKVYAGFFTYLSDGLPILDSIELVDFPYSDRALSAFLLEQQYPNPTIPSNVWVCFTESERSIFVFCGYELSDVQLTDIDSAIDRYLSVLDSAHLRRRAVAVYLKQRGTYPFVVGV